MTLLCRQNVSRTEPLKVSFASCCIWKLFIDVAFMHARLAHAYYMSTTPTKCVARSVNIYFDWLFQILESSIIASLWKYFWINTFKRIFRWSNCAVRNSVALFFLNVSSFSSTWAHALPSSFHCSSSTLLPAGTLTWESELIMLLPSANFGALSLWMEREWAHFTCVSTRNGYAADGSVRKV